MNTRRGFLRFSSLAIASQLSTAPLPGRETTDIRPASIRDYWNDLPNYLVAVVNAARVRRKSELAKIRTTGDAAARASFVREKVWELIGGQLEKAPLNVRAAGVVDREAYRIEKLIFESQREFYTPAHLYLPKSGNTPFPTIISPLGHTANGKLYRSYQLVFQNLAKKGFAVFTWDPPGQGERLQYPARTGTNRSRFGPTGEHEQFGWPAFLVGSTTTQFEVWDAVCALDYLAARPEVDSARIGCCGHSGGGTQAMYLCALEPRIQAVVVVEGHTENVAGTNYEPPGAYADAEQNIVGSLKWGLDRGDLLSTFAPKPLLICYTHMDVGTTYSPHYEQGTQEVFQESKEIYALCGAAEKVALSASNLPHDYDFFHRRATYDWFSRWLGGEHSDHSEAEFDESPDSALLCTSTGQILTSLGGRTAYQVNFDRLLTIQTSRGPATPNQEKLRQVLRGLLSLPAHRSTIRHQALSTSRWKDLVVEEFEFHSEPEVRIPGWFLKLAGRSAKLPVVLKLSSGNKNSIFDDRPLLRQIVEKNLALCNIDVRARGEATPRLPSSGPLFYGHGVEMAYSLVSLAAGVPLTGQRTWDILNCLDYLQTREDVDIARIGVWGNGASGIEALFATALDNRVRTLLLDSTLTDFRSLVASEDYNLKVESFTFGLLKHFDLPELCESLGSRPVWLLNPVNPKGEPLPESDIKEKYKAMSADRITIRIQPTQVEAIIGEWIGTTLV